MLRGLSVVFIVALAASMDVMAAHNSGSNGLVWSPCPAYTSLKAQAAANKNTHEAHVDELVAALTTREWLGIHAFSRDRPTTLSAMRAASVNDTNGSSDEPATEKLEAECTLAKLPLFYDAQQAAAGEQREIEVFAKRLRGTGPAPRKSLWLLQGGPGGSSDSLEPAMHVFHQQLPDFDVYTLDHRGVGRSTRMSCLLSQAETQGSPGGVSIEEQEFSPCNDEVRATGTTTWSFAFTTDNAARDLARLIDQTRNGSEVLVYGISYGTAWAQRYLLLNPTQPTGVVLDGVVTQAGGPGERTTFDNWAKGQNEIGFRYLKYCERDPECAARFGGDPIMFTARLFNRLFGGERHCANGTAVLSGNMLRGLIGMLLMAPETRPLFPALVHRFNRCSSDDVEFFKMVVKRFTPPSPGPEQPPLSSPQLQINVAASELLDLDRSMEDVKTAENSVFFGSPGGSMYMRWGITHDFPIYPRDPLTFNQTALAPEVPVLLINGDLDPQTPDPYARKTAFDLQGRTKSAQLVIVPGAVHYALMRSAVNDSKLHCGMQMTLSFVRDPNGQVDTSCLQRLLPVDFKGDSAFNKVMMYSIQQGDLYDGKMPSPTQPTPPVVVTASDGVSWRTFIIVVVLLSAAVVAVAGFTGAMVHHAHLHKHRRHARSHAAAAAAAPAAAAKRGHDAAAAPSDAPRAQSVTEAAPTDDAPPAVAATPSSAAAAGGRHSPAPDLEQPQQQPQPQQVQQGLLLLPSAAAPAPAPSASPAAALIELSPMQRSPSSGSSSSSCDSCPDREEVSCRASPAAGECAELRSVAVE